MIKYKLFNTNIVGCKNYVDKLACVFYFLKLIILVIMNLRFRFAINYQLNELTFYFILLIYIPHR